MNSAEDFLDERFVMIDGVHFRLDYHYYEEDGSKYLSGFNTNFNDTEKGRSAYLYVVVQTDEQHDLISDYIWRIDERKVKKIKCFYRDNCFAYDIKKLKFDGMSIKKDLDVAKFHTETANMYWASHKDHYTEEDVKIFKKLDEDAENLRKSLSQVSKYNL
jgi:hypothetical protein